MEEGERKGEFKVVAFSLNASKEGALHWPIFDALEGQSERGRLWKTNKEVNYG
jgi:hypothetical protein